MLRKHTPSPSQSLVTKKTKRIDAGPLDGDCVKNEEYITNPYFEYIKDPVLLDYTKLPIMSRLKWKKDSEKITVGEYIKNRQWVFYISIQATKSTKIVNKLIEILISENVPFQMATGIVSHRSIILGGNGYAEVGKVFQYHPANEEQCKLLISKIAPVVKNIEGPAVPTALKCETGIYFEPASTRALPPFEKIKYLITLKTANIPFTTIKHPNSHLKPQFLLGTFYVVKQELSTSAKSSIYHCISILNGFKDCIVKEASTKSAVDQLGRSAADRLVSQYEILTSLKPTNVTPRPLKLRKLENSVLLVLEYIDGQPLHEVINKMLGGAIWQELSKESKSRLLTLFMNCITAIKQLHEIGYAHRDITTTNIIVTKTNNVKIIDIELAFHIPDQGKTPFFSGTPGYRSPEQFAYQAPTFKEDIFSLGALLSVFLTGIQPSEFATSSQVPSVAEISKYCKDDELNLLIKSCLSHNPRSRPTIVEIEKEIEHFISSKL